MSTKQKALKRAAELGVELIPGGCRHFEVKACAPEGHVMAGAGVHETVSACWDADPQSVAWEGVLRDMESGIAPCDDPDCEWCHP